MPSAKQKRIKRQIQYVQNKDAAKCYMKEYREKKKDSIQLTKNIIKVMKIKLETQ